jgi:hypothetical protein
MLGAQFVGDEAVQAPGKDGDEGDLDEGDEMFLRALEDGVQSPFVDSTSLVCAISTTTIGRR